jgi:hypothetical protein
MPVGDSWAQVTAHLHHLWLAIVASGGPALHDVLSLFAPLRAWLAVGHRALLLSLALEGLILLAIVLRGAQRFAARREVHASMGRHRQRINLRGRRLAAEQGDPVAQSDLGRMYAAGEVVPRDYVHAHMWLSLAVGHGHAAAAEMRDRVARMMTSDQLAKAQELANGRRGQAG